MISYTANAQHPTAKIEFVGKDPVIVQGAPNGHGAPVLYAWQWSLRRFQLFKDRSPLGTMEKGALVIPEGRYELSVVDPRTFEAFLNSSLQNFEDSRFRVKGDIVA